MWTNLLNTFTKFIARLSTDKLFLFCVIVLIIGAVNLAFAISNYLFSKNGMKKNLKDLAGHMNAKEFLRQKTERDRSDDIGFTEEKGFLHYLDKKIRNSNIKMTFPWLSTELCLIIVLVTSITAAVGTFILTNEATYAIITVIMIPALAFGVLSILVVIEHAKITSDLPGFLNLVENTAPAFNNLYQVFDSVAPFMKKNLRKALIKCSTTARLTGDEEKAIREMSENIGHDKLSNVLTNLEIASKYTSDYSDAVEELKDNLMTELRHRKEIRGIKVSASATWTILFGAGIFCGSKLGLTVDAIISNPTCSALLVALCLLFVFNVYNFVSSL